MRIFYLIIFGVIYSFTDLLIIAIAIIQALASLVGEGPIPSVKKFGAELAIYLKQIAEFMAYHSDVKPFPYSDWPEVEVPVSEELSPEEISSEEAGKEEEK